MHHLVGHWRRNCRFARKLLAAAFLPMIAIKPAFIAFENRHADTAECGDPRSYRLLPLHPAGWWYPLVMWNEHGQATRTNNRVEGRRTTQSPQQLNRLPEHPPVGGRSEVRAGGHWRWHGRDQVQLPWHDDVTMTTDLSDCCNTFDIAENSSSYLREGWRTNITLGHSPRRFLHSDDNINVMDNDQMSLTALICDESIVI